MESIRDSFKKHKYPLDQICHYYGITFPPQPVDIDSFIEKLRQKFDIEMNLGEEKLRPFTISLSNFGMPVIVHFLFDQIKRAFMQRCWSEEEKISEKIAMRHELFKNEVAIEIETSHITHTYKDYILVY